MPANIIGHLIDCAVCNFVTFQKQQERPMFMRFVNRSRSISPLAGGDQSRDRDGAEVERCSVGASEPRALRGRGLRSHRRLFETIRGYPNLKMFFGGRSLFPGISNKVQTRLAQGKNKVKTPANKV